MSHDEKVARLIAELEAHGIRRGSIVPPIYKWLWKLGVLVPPPHCQHWTGLAALTTINFAAMFLVLTLLWRWRAPALPGWLLWALPLTGGAIFGLLMTAAYRYAAALLKLPVWKEYPDYARAESVRQASPWVRCDLWVRLMFAAGVLAMLAAAVAGLP
ncbi:MAG: hypothetical protein FJ271_29715 [Planctomycetes bacterium]|nr:hypothetical protein [Planctomycetota bacterium]